MINAAKLVIAWWEIECGWGKKGWEPVPRRLGEAVLALPKKKAKP